MICERLYELLELPEEVKDKLLKNNYLRYYDFYNRYKDVFFDRACWDDAVKEIQRELSGDEDGMKILWVELDFACRTYDEYRKTGIPERIFIDTMKFCTRFVNQYHEIYGEYKFVWGWWFPRQISMQEFRIGSLEFEFIADKDIIAVHIPSDADLSPESVNKSFSAFKEFREVYYPEWMHKRIGCDSWMMSPVLKQLLAEDSNILKFQNLFDTISTDYDSMAVLDWVFPGYSNVDDSLPENTSLQRKMKKYLICGGKIGWSTAVMPHD